MEDRRRRYPLACPVCGHTMIGERSSSESQDVDLYRCLNCEVVVEFSSKPSTHKESGE
jgi:predicted RNA-binding Zn-ribbon protein involved in translation (DUF1610 family)